MRVKLLLEFQLTLQKQIKAKFKNSNFKTHTVIPVARMGEDQWYSMLDMNSNHAKIEPDSCSNDQRKSA